MHTEDTTYPTICRLNDILDEFGLANHISQPTHTAGHCLDIVASHSTNPITNCKLLDTTLSDHLLIHFDIIATAPLNTNTTETINIGRKIHSINVEIFNTDIGEALSNNVTTLKPDELTRDITEALSCTLNKHAPLVPLKPKTKLSPLVQSHNPRISLPASYC